VTVNFELSQSRKSRRVVAFDEALKAEPANGTAAQVDPLAVTGFLQGEGNVTSI
jgi:hypothetical protein